MKENDRLNNFTDYFIFGNIFISFIAVSMYLFTVDLFSLSLPPVFIPFIFFSTIASYSLHWYLTPPFQNIRGKALWSVKNKSFLLYAFIISSIFTVIFLWLLTEYFLMLIPLAIITFLYSAPKINARPFTWLRGKYTAKTLSLTLVWLAVTAILPFAACHEAWSIEKILYIFNRFVLILPVCILFDYRDRASDAKEGIINLATLLSKKSVHAAVFICCLASFISSAALSFYFNNMTALVLALPSVLLGAVFRIPMRTPPGILSDLWYYVFLDGIMALSAALYFLFRLLAFT